MTSPAALYAAAGRINGREVMVEVAPENPWLLSDLVEEAARYCAEKVAALPNQP